MNKTTNKKYYYDYPDQRKLAEGLRLGDISQIALKTGLSQPYVSAMCNGTRKMTDIVKLYVTKYAELNKTIEEYEPATVE